MLCKKVLKALGTDKNIDVPGILIPLAVSFLLMGIFIFAINSSKIVFETNKNNFAYNMEIIDYVEALDEIFQRTASNVKIVADTISYSYDIKKIRDAKYNAKYVQKIGALNKSILVDLPGGEGAWFQINNDLPFSAKIYNWYVKRDGKIVDLHKEIESRSNQSRKLTPEDDPYYFQAVWAKKPVWSDIYKDADTNVSMLTYSYPVYKNGVLIGVVGLDISLESLKQSLKGIQSEYAGSEIFLLNEHKKLLVGQLAPDRKSNYISPSMLKLLSKPDKINDADDVIEYVEDGVHKTAVVITLDNNYEAIISFPDKTVFRGFDRLFNTIYVIFALLVALSVITLINRNKIAKINRQIEAEAVKLKGIFNTTPSVIVLKDCKGRYLDCNDKFSELTGMSKEEIIGKTEYDIFDKETADNISYQEKIVKEKCELTLEECWHVGKDGEKVLFAKYRVPLSDSEGNCIGVLVNAVDVTKKAKEEELLRQAKEAAEKTALIKSSFLANMSHEIRTPINGMLGFLQLLAETETTEEQREFIDNAQKSSELLLNIINEILDFSKIEADKLQIENISFDVRSLVEDITVMETSNAIEKGLDIHSLICSDVPTRVYGDPRRIKQILANLISNAIKFTSEGDVTIQAALVSEQNDEAVINFTVKDTGIGIAEDKLRLIFEAFTQADASTTRQFGGTGLGLAISRKLADLMHGSISVKSTMNEGSEFTLTLPLKKDLSGDSAVEKLPDILAGTNILLVSNNLADIKIIGYHLREAGCIFYNARSGQEAIEFLGKADNIQAVIVDYKIQNSYENGFSSLIKSGGGTKDIPLILCTSFAHRGDAAKAREQGFAGYLSKPVKKAELIESVAFALGEKSEKTPKFITKHFLKEQKFSERSRILVVDDSDLNQKFIVKILKNLGINCDVANNGEEALNAFKSQKYDLILMDCQMPVKDGFEATKTIRELEKDSSHTPIIALTAGAFSSDMDKCLDCGMDDYISKPVNIDTLFGLIQKYLKINPTKDKDHNVGDSADNLHTIELLTNELGFSREDAEVFFSQYKEFLVQTVYEMESYARQKDFEKLRQIAHKLKGASANLRVDNVKQLCSELENLMANEENDLFLNKISDIKETAEKLID